MLPILLFEVLWKVMWISAVAVPHLVSGDVDAATRKVLVSCSLVVVIIAVIPWRYAWKRYVRTPAMRGVDPGMHRRHPRHEATTAGGGGSVASVVQRPSRVAPMSRSPASAP
jgi:hypothetical protein